MSYQKKKRQHIEEGLVHQYTICERLPEICRKTFKRHINTIYTVKKNTVFTVISPPRKKSTYVNVLSVIYILKY